MTSNGRSAAYPVALVAVVLLMALIGAMAISMLITGDPAFPVKVFGNARGVVTPSIASIRPNAREALPQGSVRRLQLLPLPPAVVAPSWTADGDVGPADAVYQAASALGAQDALDRARAAASRGDRATAKRLYEELARRGVAPRALLIERASVLASFGEHAEAAALLRAALPRFRGDRELGMLAAQNAWWAQQPFVADSLLENVFGLDSADADAKRLRRTIRSSVEAPLTVAERWARESADARLQLGYARALVRAQRFGASIAPYRLALADPAVRTDSLLLEAASAATAADSVQALEELTERYLARRPADTEALLRLARAYSWRGDYTTALRHYARIPRMDPAFRYEVAQALVWSRRETEAARLLEDVVAASPAHADAWKLLGDLAAWRGDWTQATAYYTQATRVQPGLAGLAEALTAAQAQAEEARRARFAGLPTDTYQVAMDGFADNQGFRWATTRASRAFVGAGASFRVTAQHQVLESGPTGLRTRNPGASARVDATVRLRDAGQLDATGGVESYAGVRNFPVLGLAATVYDVFDMRVTAEVRHQPAAFRVASLAALQARATSTLLGIGASASRGKLAVWTRAEGERIATITGDARRVSGVVALQRSLGPRLGATAGVSALAYDRAAPQVPGFGSAFWSPRYYVEPSVGVTYRTPVGGAWTLGTGATAGYGLVGERAEDRRFDRAAVPTGALSADLTYRTRRWDVGIEGSSGGAVAGGYRSNALRVQATYRFGQ